MVRYNRKLEYSPLEIAHHVIQRDTVFMDMLSEFKKIPFKVDLKTIYAYLDPDPLAMTQFVIICKITETPPPDAEIQRTRRRYLMISAPNFSLTSLQSYHMAKRDGKIDDYFAELTSQPIVVPEAAFFDFITHEAELSLDANSEKYWKKPENAATLAKHVMHVGTLDHTR